MYLTSSFDVGVGAAFRILVCGFYYKNTTQNTDIQKSLLNTSTGQILQRGIVRPKDICFLNFNIEKLFSSTEFYQFILTQFMRVPFPPHSQQQLILSDL